MKVQRKYYNSSGDPIGLLWNKLRVFFTVDRNAHLKLTNDPDFLRNGLFTVLIPHYGNIVILGYIVVGDKWILVPDVNVQR